MTNDIDWARELDASFGDGPQPAPATASLPAGRRALRRRRRLTGAGAAASVVALVGLGWWGVPAVVDRADPAPYATTGDASATPDPTATPDADPTVKETSPASVQFLGEAATYDDAGTLRFAKGWTEVSRVTNPMGYSKDGWDSVGLEVVKGDQRRFLLISLQDGGTSVFSNSATGSLEPWLAGKVALQRSLDDTNTGGTGGGTGSGDVFEPVTMLPTGRLVAGPGVRILAQDDTVDLGAAFAPAGSPVVAAKVRAADGSIIWAVGRVVDGSPEVITESGRHPSLAAFVDWARGEYAGGSGLR